MELHSSLTILTLAFGLGMLHALDADHIMAVSSLSSTRAGLRRSLQFCARWAIGHGAALLIIGIAVIGFGMAIPAHLSELAESLVGLVLIALGSYVFWDLLRQRAHLHFHQHDDLPKHAHWHHHNERALSQSSQQHKKHPHSHQHGALMVGVLHGTAGSAPLLALIPITQLHSAWLGMLYIILFGLGVLLTMLIFGGLLGGTFQYLMRWGNQIVRAVRVSVASGAIAFGFYLLQGHMS